MAKFEKTLTKFRPKGMDAKRRFHLSGLSQAMALPIIEGDEKAVSFRNFAIHHHLKELTILDTSIPVKGEVLRLAAIAKLADYGLEPPIETRIPKEDNDTTKAWNPDSLVRLLTPKVNKGNLGK